jgi:hypothetical protein
MRRYVPVVLICAILPICAFSENRQTILPIDSDVVSLLESIYLEQGMALLTTAGPYSMDEIHSMLEKIDPETLSPAGKAAFDAILGDLTDAVPAENTDIAFGWRPSSAVEAYYHTNPDPSTTEWETTWSGRQPLVSIPIDFWAGEGAYATLELSVKQTHDAFNPAILPSNCVNIPLSLDYIDYEMPFRAFLSLGGPSWSFIIGRDRFSWGNGRTGNLMISDAPDYYDFTRFTGYWRDFKYSALWVMLDNDLAPYQTAAATADVLANSLISYPRNYFLHRLDFSVLDRLSLSKERERVGPLCRPKSCTSLS